MTDRVRISNKGKVNTVRDSLPTRKCPNTSTSISTHRISGPGFKLPSESVGTARSKTGCWTCRTRKVKCDESKPLCSQCQRLNYVCDWRPRLHFKDDTPKILGRMRSVSIIADTVWDPSFKEPACQQQCRVNDTLPPFTDLLNDEQREQKAALYAPGTFTVIVNPASFLSLPEYQGCGTRQVRENSVSSANSNLNTSCPVEQPLRIGPNSIVLRRFEDGTDGSLQSYFSQISIINKEGSQNSKSSTSSNSIAHVETESALSSERYESPRDTACPEERDTHLIEHYREVLAQQLATLSDKERGPDVFERYSQNYLPLYLAIIALASLSLACLENRPVADALEVHKHIIPALQDTVQSLTDSFSDGALFTHYFLLRFEVAAAGQRECNMWEYHSDQLLRVLKLRHQAYGPERHHLIIVWAMYIDIYALLATSGKSTFITGIIRENMLPSLERNMQLGKNSGLLMEISSDLQKIMNETYQLMKMNRQMAMTALRIGQKAQELRAEARASQESACDIAVRQSISVQQEHSLLSDFHDAWSSQLATSETWLEELGDLPGGAFTLRVHAHLLYRACVIYSHTSMYYGQMSMPSPGSEKQVETCAREILQIASMILERRRFEFRYVIFPIFLAGFATKNMREKEIAVESIRSFQKTSYGMSTKNTRRLLEVIHKKQHNAVIQTGTCTNVSWIDELEMTGERLIIFGL